VSDKEKILKTLSSLLETGILTANDVKKELITNFKFKKDDIVNKLDLVSREELADEEFDESELRKVDVGITRLRQKIETVPKKPQFIKTIRSKGYMLVCREL